MLFYHQIDSLLCIVKVELVVIGLLIFLLVLFRITILVVRTTATSVSVPVLEEMWSTLRRFRLGQAVHLVRRTTEDLLLELHLLAQLLSSFAARPLVCQVAIALEECLRARSNVIGSKWLRSHVVEQ